MSGLRGRQQASGPTPTSSLSFDEVPTRAAAPTSTPSAAPAKHNSTNPTVIIAVIVSLAAVLGLTFGWLILRRTRNKHKNPKYVPTVFLKKLWEKWEPEPVRYRLPDHNGHLEPQRTTGAPAAAPSSFDTSAGGAAAGTNAAVDRHTSVRSVMTLPAYNPSARENEQVLGREGDRGGIDVVIEFPEGADDEEDRREAEMEALYQVRLARRRENEEREERRRLRREARERGDYVALRELQAQARAGAPAGTGRTVEELRAEHERVKKERQRAVSSVSYAELGVARHDGTRLRANSNDSEREGLLGDAASIAASTRYHRRDRSASSVISIDTTHSGQPSPDMTRSRGNSRASVRPDSPHTMRRGSAQSLARSGPPSPPHEAGSSPEMVEHEDIPPNSPPGYENIPLQTPVDRIAHEPPPDYSSPIAGRGERRSMFNSPRASMIDSQRASAAEVSQLMSEDPRSSISTSTPPGSGEATSSPRTTASGTPRLPSLKLPTLPSIEVNSPSPIIQVNEDEEHLPRSNV